MRRVERSTSLLGGKLSCPFNLLFPTDRSQTKANEFEGAGGPADKVKIAEGDRRGDDDVTGTTRQKQF